MKPDVVKSQNLDANETAFFEDQLRYVKTKTYDRKYPEFGLFGNIPISYEVPKHKREIEVRSYDMTGIAKIISDFADDLPRVDVVAISATVKVRTLGDAYGYSVDEITTASALGESLDGRKAIAAKRAIIARMNNIAWKARPATHYGMTGLFFTSGIPCSQFPLNAGATSRKWKDKTSNEILADLNLMAWTSWKLTNGIERPDTILLTQEAYGIATTKKLADNGSDTTIAEFFLKTNPWIKRIDTIAELMGVSPRPSGIGTTTDSCNVCIAYKNDPEKLTFEIPMQFEQLPVEPKGLEMIINCMAKTAGTLVYYPLSITFWEDAE